MNSAQLLAFFGLTIIVAILLAVLVFAFLRFSAAARDSRRSLGDSRMDTVLLSTALEDAIARLKDQERATARRADASERMSGQIVESLTSGLLVVDHEGRMQIVNPAARRILGLEEPLPSAPYQQVLAGAPALAGVLDETLRSQAPVSRRTVTLDTRDGPMHLGVTVSPLASTGDGHGAICLFTDLTNVVALEEQLRLKEALARLGELTAGLAHEFRNGLATIHGYGRLLDPAALPAQYRPYVDGIRQEAQTLGEIVTNFLNFAKPDPLMLAPVDLAALLTRAAEDIPAARVTCRGAFSRVDADEVLLRQAFSNLFRNSVEACQAAHTPPEVLVRATRDPRGHTVNLEISDNGPGIAADAIGRVFQPFFTTRPGGTGLGLAIVQKVIVSHNGSISAGNLPDGGAVFRISLPAPADDPIADL